MKQNQKFSNQKRTIKDDLNTKTKVMSTKTPSVVICANCKRFWHSGVESCVKCYSTSLAPTDPRNAENITWIETDPDNYQFGRQIGVRLYEFKEYDWKSPFAKDLSLQDAQKQAFNWTQCTIDLDTYSDEQKENVAQTYYGSLDELKEQCGDSWEWILAESIFEIESNLY